MILVPVKNLANAKERLAPAVEHHARTELAHAMLRDVLGALSDYGEDEVSLVTSDPFAEELASQYGFGIIRDESNLSETNAIEMATRLCESRGVESTLVIPADIPLIDAREIHAIYERAPENGSDPVPPVHIRETTP